MAKTLGFSEPTLTSSKKQIVVPAVKKYILRNYLQFFWNLKTDIKCDHLIVAGDFNDNMDKFNKKHEHKYNVVKQKALAEEQSENIALLKKYDLVIVPYENQRNKNKLNQKNISKYDTLICDKGLTQDGKVKVYCNKKASSDLPDTEVVHVDFSEQTLNHHPLLFTLKFTVETENAERENNEEAQNTETENAERVNDEAQSAERENNEEAQNTETENAERENDETENAERENAEEAQNDETENAERESVGDENVEIGSEESINSGQMTARDDQVEDVTEMLGAAKI